MSSRPIFRISIIGWFIMLAAVGLVVRLFFIQIVDGAVHSAEAARQYVAPAPDVFNRGKILFTLKDGTTRSAATLKSGATLAIKPDVVTDAPKLYGIVNEITPIDNEAFFLKAAKKDDPYEEIARRVPSDAAEKIRKLNLPSVVISEDRWRFYPAGGIAAHVLGFVGYHGRRLDGRYGIERFYNELLSRDSKNLYVNFFAEVFSNISATVFQSGSLREGDIILSIEPSVQAHLESSLEDIMEKWQSAAAGGIIMDPKTGEIYALAARPAFDPNAFNIESDQSVFGNPIVENVYEMGSIIKPLTIAAALDADAITPETTYYDHGFVEMDDARIENFDGKGRGRVPMQEVLNQSLNTGAVFAMNTMGKEAFREYFLNFGLGEPTGIDLPNEVSGLVHNLDSTRTIEYATASFGQGIAMTPIATIRALAALGNGGLLQVPHVGRAIAYDVGFTRDIEYAEPVRVLSEETSEEITRMLVSVVDDALLGGTVALPRYSIAAKTGTAQIADGQKGGYYNDRYLHSFFGYFPAYDPKFIVFLYAVNPKEVRYASQTLTEPFIDTAKFLLNYYDIPPDR